MEKDLPIKVKRLITLKNYRFLSIFISFFGLAFLFVPTIILFTSIKSGAILAMLFVAAFCTPFFAVGLGATSVGFFYLLGSVAVFKKENEAMLVYRIFNSDIGMTYYSNIEELPIQKENLKLSAPPSVLVVKASYENKDEDDSSSFSPLKALKKTINYATSYKKHENAEHVLLYTIIYFLITGVLQIKKTTVLNYFLNYKIKKTSDIEEYIFTIDKEKLNNEHGFLETKLLSTFDEDLDTSLNKVQLFPNIKSMLKTLIPVADARPETTICNLVRDYGVEIGYFVKEKNLYKFNYTRIEALNNDFDKLESLVDLFINNNPKIYNKIKNDISAAIQSLKPSD